jgi:glutamate transport system permease protein
VSEAVLYDHPGPRALRRARLASVVGGIIVLAVVAGVLARFYERGHFDAVKWEAFEDPDTWRAIGQGLRNTLKAASLAIVLSMATGVLLAVGRLSDRAFLRLPAVTVVEFFRAVPLLMLIFFFFLASPNTLGSYGALVAGLTLYNGAVIAEIFRAGILAVPKGQREAAYAIGLRPSQTMQLVLVPQALRSMLPALISQAVVVLKDTSLGYIVVYPELVRVGRQIYDNYFNIIPSIMVVTVIYVTMNMTLSWVAQKLERRTRRQYGRAVLSTDVDAGAAV